MVPTTTNMSFYQNQGESGNPLHRIHPNGPSVLLYPSEAMNLNPMNGFHCNPQSIYWNGQPQQPQPFFHSSVQEMYPMYMNMIPFPLSSSPANNINPGNRPQQPYRSNEAPPSTDPQSLHGLSNQQPSFPHRHSLPHNFQMTPTDGTNSFNMMDSLGLVMPYHFSSSSYGTNASSMCSTPLSVVPEENYDSMTSNGLEMNRSSSTIMNSSTADMLDLDMENKESQRQPKYSELDSYDDRTGDGMRLDVDAFTNPTNIHEEPFSSQLKGDMMDHHHHSMDSLPILWQSRSYSLPSLGFPSDLDHRA
jgi:hypothetical protein